MQTRWKFFLLALAQLALIIAVHPAIAKPMVQGKPFKIHPETAKYQCGVMDGTFRYAAGGGFTCTIYGAEAKITQTCNYKGQCTSTRDPYEKP